MRPFPFFLFTENNPECRFYSVLSGLQPYRILIKHDLNLIFDFLSFFLSFFLFYTRYTMQRNYAR